MTALDAAKAYAQDVSITPNAAVAHGLELNHDGQRRSAYQLLGYPDITLTALARIWPQLGDLPPKIADQLEISAKYEVYLQRQAADVAAFRRDEDFELPTTLDYEAVKGLSNEARQKLIAIRPRTLGQAGRLDGVTPATLTLLVAHTRRRQRAS
jgi:tRNA uridine 5-carboxymethylaminomethyl modification enzyme